MDLRQITPDYIVSPQIEPGDMDAIAAAGISRIICNRPDAENPPGLQSAAMAAQAAEHGLDFHYLPLTHQSMTPDNMDAQAALIADAPGKVMAYCASGTRSTVIWALGRAGQEDADTILAAARAAGYDLEGLRPALVAARR